jgi:hypothetical protein
MASYMLFAPGAKHGPDVVRQFGLETLEADGALSWLASRGPGDAEGLLGGWLDVDPSKSIMAYQPVRQTWQQCPGFDLWIGTENEKPVRPEDLQRAKCQPGNWVQMADGNHWLIPVAKWLPHLHGLNEFRQPCQRPKPQFVEFCQMAEGVLDSLLTTSTDGKIRCEVDWDFVCDALAMNYRLIPDAVSLLGLVDDRSGIQAMAVVSGMQAIVEVEIQKKTAESADIPAG